MKIIDNFMPKKWHRELCQTVIDNPSFPWYDNRVLLAESIVEERHNQHFCHVL